LLSRAIQTSFLPQYLGEAFDSRLDTRLVDLAITEDACRWFRHLASCFRRGRDEIAAGIIETQPVAAGRNRDLSISCAIGICRVALGESRREIALFWEYGPHRKKVEMGAGRGNRRYYVLIRPKSVETVKKT
jgi:hypothetical protein